MSVVIGTTGGNRDLVDPKVGDGGARKDVQEIYAWHGGTRSLVWFRQPLAMTAAALAWDDARLTITPPGSGADSYVIYRNGTQIATPTGPGGSGVWTYDDLNVLVPSTAYTYRVRAIRGGVTVGDVTAPAITTPAYPDLGLSASAASYAQVNTAWAAAIGSIDRFDLYRNGALIYQGLGTSKADTGLAASSGYNYELRALRGGTVIRTDTASASTPARPTSSAIAYGPAVGSGYGWAQSTAKQLGGPNFTLSGGGTNYISYFNNRINGYSGSTGKFQPHIGGHTYGYYYPSGTGAGDVRWSEIGGENRTLGSGTHGTWTKTGGDANYRSQWQPYSGGSYSSTICWGQVNYWWYSSTDLREEYRDREIRQVTLNDFEGVIVAGRIWDAETDALLEEWGDLRALDARIAEEER